MKRTAKRVHILLSCLMAAAVLATQGGAHTATVAEPVLPPGTSTALTDAAANAATPAVKEAVARDGSLRGLRIGFSQVNLNVAWRMAQTESMRNEADRLGAELVCRDAQYDIAKQVADIEIMIAQGLDYIVVVPCDAMALEPVLGKAGYAGIPVLLLEIPVDGVDYAVLIESDYEKQGELAGNCMVDALGGSGNVAVLEGSVGSKAAVERQAGFEKAIEGTDIRIIYRQSGEFFTHGGVVAMETALMAFGGEIDAVFAHNDLMALGAISAVKAFGLQPGKDISVFSVDGTRDALEAIVAGDLVCSVQHSPHCGPVTLGAIARLEAGEEVPRRLTISDMVFDSGNAAQYVNSVIY